VAQETQRANIALARHYWASAVNAQEAGDVLRAVHFFARSGSLRSEPSEVNNAIFAVHNYLKPLFLGLQMAHGAVMKGMVFSNDERLILSWGDDGTVRLWQASDGTAIAVMKHERGVRGVEGARARPSIGMRAACSAGETMPQCGCGTSRGTLTFLKITYDSW
jgi:WD40 repeat protein